MGTVEQVRVARRTGFCYGVREAIDHARTSAADGKETLTLGQTVHNEGVISDLRSRGIRTVDTLDTVEPGTSVVIRAHGVTPEVMETAQRRGLDVIDGTCSWVVQEHREVARLVEEGYTIVLLGTPNHPEVVGILGYAPDAILVDEEEEWERIPRTKRMALVSQSTQPPWKFQKLAAFMVSRAHELKIVNTVCPVTIRRQEDTIELADQVDMMVVVGGRNSANTRELTRLVGIAGKPAVQVERAAELTDAQHLRRIPRGRHHGRHLDAHRGPRDGDTPGLRARGHARRCRHRPRRSRSAAIAEVADPAYRSTSIGRPERGSRSPTRPDRPRRRGLSGPQANKRVPPARTPRAAPRRTAPGGHRRPSQRRQVDAVQPHGRRPDRHRRGPRPHDA